MTYDVPERMRIHLGLVSWRTQGTRTGWCYAETVRQLDRRHEVTHETWANDAVLERSRSLFLTRFQQGGAGDVVLWADSDTIWPTAAAERICRSAYQTRGIVGAIYSKRSFGGGITTRFVQDEGSPKSVNIGEDRLLPAELLGGGFMAIHRAALDRIAVTLPWVSDSDRGDWQPYCKTELIPLDDGRMHFAAEDEALCLAAHRCGAPVMCDVSIVLGHEGAHVFTVADGQRKREG